MPHASVDGVRIHYRWDGPEAAPVLVFSNSLGTHLGMWDPQVGALAGEYRILRYDSRGHGGSDVPPGPYSIERLGRDVVGLLDALGVARAHFCGLSLGGMVGIWLGANAPERIERLALCNTSPYLGPPEVWNTRIEAVRRDGMAAVADSVIERWFSAQFRATHPAQVEPIRRMLLDGSPEGYAACAAAVRDMDLRGSLAAIRAPTLVVAGAHDPSTPIDHTRAIAAGIRGARLVELHAAHLSNVEAAAAFCAVLREHLGGGAAP